MKSSDLNHEKFRSYIIEETKCLREAYNSLKEMEKSEDMQETLLGEINVCCGQSELLIKQRFAQFATLIDDSELRRGEKEVTLQDLQGFWDIVMIQVDDIKKKIEKTKTIKNEKSPLVEIIPKVTTVKMERRKILAVPKKSKVESSSGKASIRNHILAMRRAMNQKGSQNSKDAIIITFENCKENILFNENLNLLQTPSSVNITKTVDTELSSKRIKKTPASKSSVNTKKAINSELSSKRVKKTPNSKTPRLETPVLSSSLLKKNMLLSPMIHKDYSPCTRVTRSMKKCMEAAKESV